MPRFGKILSFSALRRFGVILAAVFISLAVYFKWFESLELLCFDLRFKIRPAHKISKDIVLVEKILISQLIDIVNY